MRRLDLIRELEKAGCDLLRHGGRHDIDHNPTTGRSEPVPRHREINEILARRIIRRLTAVDEDSGREPLGDIHFLRVTFVWQGCFKVPRTSRQSTHSSQRFILGRDDSPPPRPHRRSRSS